MFPRCLPLPAARYFGAVPHIGPVPAWGPDTAGPRGAGREIRQE